MISTLKKELLDELRAIELRDFRSATPVQFRRKIKDLFRKHLSPRNGLKTGEKCDPAVR